MARKKETDSALDEIKKNLEAKKLIIGTSRTLKMLRQGKISKIFLSSNCPAEVKDEIMHFIKFTGSKLVETAYPNDELGVLCKKSFNISVLSVLK